MSRAGDWPRTYRVLPWLLAGFLTMIWFIPTEAIELSVSLPIDSNPDRFLLLAIAGLWLASIVTQRSLVPTVASPAFTWALMFFLAVALISVLVNAQTLANVGEMEQAVKKLVVLVGYGLLFYVVASVIRPSELRNFGILLVVLAAVAAAATIYEYRTNYNVFYDLAGQLFGGIAQVAPTPNEDGYGRPDTFGATTHGLAITTMLALALPFAVLGLGGAPTRPRKFLYAVAVALILAGGLSTLRKTSAIVPLVALSVLVAYRPRDMLRLAPVGVVLLAVIHVAAPAALGSVWSQFTGGFFESGTTQGRTSDYQQISPDVASHPLIGRGYGTIDPARDDTYRILDNEYLGQLIQVGFLGVAAYLALIAVALWLAHGVIKLRGDPVRSRFALAAAAGFAGFAVSSALFDILSFPQVPYLFLFIAGLCSVAAAPAQRRSEPVPLARPVAVS